MYFRSSLLLLLSGVAIAKQLRESRTLSSALEEIEGIALSTALLDEFHSWMEYHGKEYDSHDEQLDRLKTWVENDAFIRRHNEQVPKPSYTMGHNAFSDMSADEFEMHYQLGKYATNTPLGVSELVLEEAETRSMLEASDLPDEVNWVAAGAVTPVKDQGFCGSCWAFSTTGALEGAKFLATGELVALSEQNLLDCDHTDMACRGGLMDNAFKFDEKEGGLCSEADYPYQAKRGVCLTNCTDVPGTHVTGYYDVIPGDNVALMAAIVLQPISIAIQANQAVFQFYKDGVITDDTCGKYGMIDHGVLAVGYGSDAESGDPYYLVKNSWGPAWGSAGYVKLGRESANRFGVCAITRMASYPVVEA